MKQQTVSSEIAQLQNKVKELEDEIRLFEGVLGRVLVSPPVMFRMPDGSKRPFSPTRPVSLRTLAMMLKVEEASQEHSRLTEDERSALFMSNLEAARREAIAKGIAIEDEREAAVGD